MLNLLNENTSARKVEDAYITVRKAEGRLYSDREVLMLPDLSPHHLLYKEWMIRKYSLKQILKFLQKETPGKSLLDIGCGNGWMCNHLQKAGFAVTGLDINKTELEQATKLFPDVNFVYADIFQKNDIGKFDVAVLSASIQYFPDAIKLIQHLKEFYLSEKGIIIIADTYFYKQNELVNAGQRTKAYYQNMNAPEMAKYYFHHAIETFHHFSHSIINKRSIFDFIRSKLKNYPQPFQLFVIY